METKQREQKKKWNGNEERQGKKWNGNEEERTRKEMK